MKALIPMAGKGTRLKPFTLFRPKELLFDGAGTVILWWIFRELKSFVKEVILVIDQKRKPYLPLVRSLGAEFGLELEIVYQDPEQKELLGAVRSGLGNQSEPFLVIFPDEPYLPSYGPEPLELLIKSFEETGLNQTILHRCLQNQTQRYGIAQIDRMGNVLKLREKPPETSHIPLNSWSLGGRVILNSATTELIKQGTFKTWQETLKNQPLIGIPAQNPRWDIGNLPGYLQFYLQSK